jgi:fructose/tagatose bisphosphate aldolase
MPFISIVPELKRAQTGGYAIPLFDAFDMFSVEGMIVSAEAKRAPVIVALYDAVLEHPNARALANYIRTRAEKAAAPISLMLDHGKSFEQCIRALTYGFSDVMFDGSQLPLEENIAPPPRHRQSRARGGRGGGSRVGPCGTRQSISGYGFFATGLH